MLEEPGDAKVSKYVSQCLIYLDKLNFLHHKLKSYIYLFDYCLEKLKPLALNLGIGIWMLRNVHTMLCIQGLGQSMMVLLL